MFKEFKEFAMKGNIIDLAIGIVIGGAFQKIVNSLVNDIIMPLTSILTGNADYLDWIIEFGNIKINIGTFIGTVINFLIIAISIFLVIKYLNKLNKKLERIKENELEKFNKRMQKVEKLNKKLGTDKLIKKKKKVRIDEEPTSKICPFCLSEVSIKATRCKYCTSILEEIEEKSK